MPMQVGDRMTAGDIYATVPENTLIEHRVMLPPGARGTLTWIAPQGQYGIDEEVIEVEFGGVKKASRSWFFSLAPAFFWDASPPKGPEGLILGRQHPST